MHIRIKNLSNIIFDVFQKQTKSILAAITDCYNITDHNYCYHEMHKTQDNFLKIKFSNRVSNFSTATTKKNSSKILFIIICWSNFRSSINTYRK